MSTQPQQLQLPYAEVGKVANREFIRSNKEIFTQTPRASFKMPLSKIQERDGFNSRIKYEEIQELAEDIFNRGQDEPMVLDITESGIGLIDCGHRRFRAFQLNVELGRMEPDVLVEFYPNKASVTELDRMVRQITSNVNLKKDLKVYEKAKVAWNVKNLYTEKPLSHEEVAKLLHLSRQTVDNLIKIHEADDALKNTMVERDLNLKDCLALVKTEKELKKQTDQVEEDSHKNTAGKTPFPKDMLADEKKELDELDAQAEQMKAEQEVDEETGEVRMTNPDLKEYEKKPLDLVGNTVANSGKEKDENDVAGAKKFDESREEVAWCQNAIKLADKLEAIVEKLDVPDGTKKDVSDIVKWLQKDLDLIRDWVNKNKRQNKMR